MASVRRRDPEEERYRRKFPVFPGVDKCVELLSRGSTRGGYLDAVMADLTEHAGEDWRAIAEHYRRAESERVRTLLLSALAEAAPAEAAAWFGAILRAPAAELSEGAWFWAAAGLLRIDTKEARRELWRAEEACAAGPDEGRERRAEIERARRASAGADAGAEPVLPRRGGE